MDDKKKLLIPTKGGGTEYYESEDKTERTKDRQKEDETFVPVIIKRNDVVARHADDTLEYSIEEGLEQHTRTNLSLFLSAFSAGLILGFAAMSVALASQFFTGSDPILYDRLAMALVYPLGFIVCILSRTKLFTEQTATALYPVLEKKSTFGSLCRVWTVVLVGNLVGTFSSSLLIYLADGVIGAKAGLIEVAHHLSAHPAQDILISSILAGWLMAQGGWLILSTVSSMAQSACIYIVTFIIGLAGLHHSIAGSAEIFGAMFFESDPQVLKSLFTVALMALGNLMGGGFFVAILNYGHIRKTR